MKTSLLIAKGILRDQSMRRSAMFVVLVTALILLFLGSTLLSEYLADHIGAFFVYWGVCGWLTLTAIFMAVYDLLRLRVEARQEQENARKEIFGENK